MSHSPKTKITRRTALTAGLGASAVGIWGLPAQAQDTSTRTRVIRFEQAAPFPVNAYIVEGPDGVVVIDATLTNTSSLALRAEVDAIGKPLRGVLFDPCTSRPLRRARQFDRRLRCANRISSRGARRGSARRQFKGCAYRWNVWSRMAAKPGVPNPIASEAETIDFGEGLKFDVMDIGPAESFHDSAFVLQGEHPHVFSGDLAYGLMHPYMADNTNPDWAKALERLQSELDEAAILYIGHGQPVTSGFLSWQASYLTRFEDVLKSQDWSNVEAATAEASAAMRNYLPQDHLAFLMELSVAPNAKRLGLI